MTNTSKVTLHANENFHDESSYDSFKKNKTSTDVTNLKAVKIIHKYIRL